MTDYQCTCLMYGSPEQRAEQGFSAGNNDGCILHDPKLNGYLMICQRLDKLIEVLTTKAHV